MTGERTLRESLTRLEEKLAYLVIYAPEFPVEDETTLQREFDRLFAQVAEIERISSGVTRSDWWRLAKLEAQQALEKYEGGDEREGSRLLQQVEERLKSLRRGERSRPTFIAGPDGTIVKADDGKKEPTH